jgi:AcrR family transcriptional regulator
MGIIERKQRDREEMRERILDAAIELFLKDGYDKTSIRQIADAIEYSPATIYLYFKDKDELFFAIHHRGFEKLFAAMSATVAVENPLERLKVIGQTYLKFAIENPEFYDLMFVMRAPMAALKHRTSCGEADCDWQHGRRSYELLVNTIQECINQYLVRIPNAEEGALLAWSVVHGMATLLIRERFAMIELSDPEQKMEAVMDHLIRVMRI